MSQPFGPIRVKLPSEEVARTIADAIRSGVYRRGSRLPSERDIAEQMQVSRPTVREAVHRLVAANILKVRPGAGGGMFVQSEIVPLDLVTEIPEIRPGVIDEALEVRRLVLPWVAQVASHYAEDFDFDQMREAIAFGRSTLPEEGQEPTMEHLHSVIIASSRFDMALARSTRNSLIVQIMELLLSWVEPMRYKTLRARENLVLALDLVEDMLDAVETNEPARIAEIVDRRLFILENALEEVTQRRLRRRRRISD